MKFYMTVLLIGFCIVGAPVASYAALDWHIRWDETGSPQIAKIYIFNPESINKTFFLEIGDVAKTSIPDPEAPQLVIGQDISLTLVPSERKIFDVIVYQDIDPRGRYAAAPETKSYQLASDNYRILGQQSTKSASSREYPYTIARVIPVQKEEEDTAGPYTYRSGRGYWTIALADHDHVLEQLIRTGDRIGALHRSVQEAILFYTQGDMQLSDAGLEVWESAFPELKAEPSPEQEEIGDCVHFVTVVSANLSQYTSSRSVRIGDILAPRAPGLSTVIAAEDLGYSVAPTTQASKRLLRVFLMQQTGIPTPESEYVSIINHDSRAEQAIRIGFAEQYSPCAIQDVVFYFNRVVAAPTIGKKLWERIGGGGGGAKPPVVTPAPTNPYPGSRGICLGNPSTQPRTRYQSSSMTFKNLLVLVGLVVPFSVIFRRKDRK